MQVLALGLLSGVVAEQDVQAIAVGTRHHDQMLVDEPVEMPPGHRRRTPEERSGGAGGDVIHGKKGQAPEGGRQVSRERLVRVIEHGTQRAAPGGQLTEPVTGLLESGSQIGDTPERTALQPARGQGDGQRQPAARINDTPGRGGIGSNPLPSGDACEQDSACDRVNTSKA